MREKLSQMTELVKQNLRKAQKKQKTWCDLHARLHEFRDGDLVLILFPLSSNKLFAQWQGPYQVLKRCGKVTYMVDMHDKEEEGIPCEHVKMLKRFNVHRSAESNYIVEVESKDVQTGVQIFPYGTRRRQWNHNLENS